VVEAIAEGFADGRFAGAAGELRREPAFEFGDERRCSGLADGRRAGAL
jgi:hypothetical protein